jgi:hypothetical protein
MIVHVTGFIGFCLISIFYQHYVTSEDDITKNENKPDEAEKEPLKQMIDQFK